jgi:hypothetical protein
VALRVQNRSRRSWPESAELTLRASGDALALGSPAVVRRAGSGAVRPGARASFRLRLRAPAAPRLLWPSWRLFRGKAKAAVVAAAPVQIFCDTGSGIERKVLAGYQGWFSCPNDGAPPGTWAHWFNGLPADAAHATFDLWPDASELTPGERCPTDMTLPDGSPAVLFSSASARTVDRHMAWMAEHGIDGVFFQRFTTTLADPGLAANRDLVLRNLLRSAERHGRRVAVAWDVTGDDRAGIRDVIARDWRHLVDDLRITRSPAYLYDHGRPLVEVWGMGFTHVAAEPEDVAALVGDFHRPSAPRFAARVMGGVPSYWRELTTNARPEPAWAEAYALFDVIQPWPVGRYDDDATNDEYREDGIEPDLALTSSRGQGYMPGVFPGFSWHNLFRNRGEDWPLNQVPRRGGRFLWHQAWNLVDAGATSIYVAMFDEADEGTAIFKVAPTRVEVPAQGRFLSLDADGDVLPADWYLRVTGEIVKMLRGETPLQPELPIRPLAADRIPGPPASKSPTRSAPELAGEFTQNGRGERAREVLVGDRHARAVGAGSCVCARLLGRPGQLPD